MAPRTARTKRTCQVVVGLTTILLTACGDVNVNPATPTIPFPIPGARRTLAIEGTLAVEQGACFEATVLYDGEELAGARTVCQQAAGCARLRLAALARSGVGRHTIAFRVLRQSTPTVAYVAAGTVRVTRDNVSLGGVTLPLALTRVTLRAGETVSFDVSFSN